MIPTGGIAQAKGQNRRSEDGELTLVRVNITAETQAGGEAVNIDGRRIANYRPKIIQVFPSTGVVIDDQGHVLTFLGYRWVDLQGAKPRIDIINHQGDKFPGLLIGIDQNIGVAVVRSQGGRLKKTPVCERCEIKDGLTVVAPVLEEAGFAQFRRSRVVSIGDHADSQAEGYLTIKISSPLPGVGEPLLNMEHLVLGFVSSQKPSPDDPKGVNTIIYHPMSQLLASAEKIMKAKGDIRTGWLGVFVDDQAGVRPRGLAIDNVLEGSPAQKAGVLAGDVIAKYNGREIRDARQFIRLVQDTKVGTRVPLDVIRDGKPLVLQALIEARKTPESAGNLVLDFPDLMRLAANAGAAENMAATGAALLAGLEAIPLTPEMAEFLEAPGQTGLLVLRVEPQTSFALAGVQAGDVILTVDERRIQNTQSLLSYLRSRSRSAQSFMLRLVRKGAERKTTVPLPLKP